MRHSLLVLVALALLCCLAPVRASAPAYVWWEGEAAFSTNFTNRAFSPSSLDHPEELSGGDWLNTDASTAANPGFAKWKIEVPESAEYYFYARKFWHHGPFKWRFDGGPWHKAQHLSLLDTVDLKALCCVNWVSLGKVKLAAGPHIFEVRLLHSQNGVGCFDCFLLSKEFFIPSGLSRPGAPDERSMQGFFAFNPGTDPFKPSLLDLSYLNDKPAGKWGFLQAKGLDFVFQRKPDRPVRFWAVDAGGEIVNMSPEMVDYCVRLLAKHGVNMIRVHTPICDTSADSLDAVNMDYLHKLHYFEAACKRQGIYLYLSVYFPLWLNMKPSYGIPGYEQLANKHPFALLFFHPTFQQAYKRWVKVLLTTKNPYTGLSLARDPAVGLFEIVNEDNYFFWTFSIGPKGNIPAEAVAPLEKAFGDWVKAKYGSLEKALAVWQRKAPRDDLAAGCLQLYDAWFMTKAGTKTFPAGGARIKDQIRFLTEHLRNFFADTRTWLRQTTGLQCPVVATNWVTADPELTAALDKYADSACEVLDRHGYFSGPNKAKHSWEVSKGDLWQNALGLSVPDKLPLREIQYAGHPCTVSEYSFSMINRFRTDSTVLAAAYGALQGIDGLFFFAVEGPSWAGRFAKWPLMVPSVLGTFPACALLYRRGDVQEAETVVKQVLSLDDLYDLKGTGVEEPLNVDAMRAEGLKQGEKLAGKAQIDPLAYYVGRVVRAFGNPADSFTYDLTPYIDRKAGVIRSLNKALEWDYSRGIVKVNTPRTQGATGLLGKVGRLDFDAASFDFTPEYGQVLVTSLTEAPLGESVKILVQVFTEDWPRGWESRPKEVYHEVLSLGGPPMNVKRLAGTVTLQRPDAASLQVVPLDGNGYPLDLPVEVERTGTSLTFHLLPGVLYYYLAKTGAG